MRSQRARKGLMFMAILLAGLGEAGAAPAGKAITLEVRAGERDRGGSPVFFELPKALAGRKHFTLTRLDTKKPVPVQVEPGPKPRAVWLIGGKLEAGHTRRYRLAPTAEARKAKTGVTVTDNGKQLCVRIGPRDVLRYNHAVVPSPDPKHPYYQRSGYIHPLHDPAGRTVTDDFAPDHMHQHGIMFPWTKTTFQGRPTEFWNQKLQLGTVGHVRFEAAGGGEVFGFFTAVLHHVALKAAGGPKTVLAETWRVRAYNRSDAFLFDVESTQRCATDSPLEIEKYHYGGMAIRGARAWLQPGEGDFLTSEGKSRKDGNHTRPRWVDIHGRMESKTSGVTFFCHRDNFRFPQPVRLHPSKPYFCFAPMVLGAFQIAPGKPYVSKYRCYVHVGKLEASLAERLWHDYVHPPEVRVVAP